MNIVGAVSRAGEKHSVLFCEYTGSERENLLIDAFLIGLNVDLDRKNIYCLAVYCDRTNTMREVVGIFYHKDGKECMMYDRPFDYLSEYVSEIFSEEISQLLRTGSDDQ